MESVDQKNPFTENSTTKGQKFMVFLNILWISDQIPGQSNPQVPNFHSPPTLSFQFKIRQKYEDEIFKFRVRFT